MIFAPLVILLNLGPAPLTEIVAEHWRILCPLSFRQRWKHCDGGAAIEGSSAFNGQLPLATECPLLGERIFCDACTRRLSNTKRRRSREIGGASLFRSDQA